MTVPKLPNYVRANRKRLGLTQDELAFLLGTQNGAKVSRYERFARAPTLESAFACEVVFHRAASKLFAGIYREIARKVTGRAKALTFQVKYRRPDRKNAHKKQILLNIADSEAKRASAQS